MTYELNAKIKVNLNVYNPPGQGTTSLVRNKEQESGSHSIDWNGTDDSGKAVTAGIYMVRLQGANSFLIRKMVLIM